MTTQIKSSQSKNIPKLRFGAFEGEWEEKKLGEIFERVKDKNTENNQNVLTISAQQGLINQQKYFLKNIASKNTSNYYLLKKGDFAYNKSYSKGYPMGAIKRLKRYDSGIVSPLYICFNLKDKNNSEYFFDKFFNAGKINRGIAKIAQEGARNHGLLNMAVGDFFNDIEIIIPKEDEQQKIANFLQNIDLWIENLKSQKENLKKYKKGVMQKIFSQELRFKDENGVDFADWEEKKLGEVLKLQGGNAFKSNLFKKTGIPIIRISNISNNNNYIDLNKLVYYSEIKNDRNFIITQNDLLVAMSGATTGKVSIYNLEYNAYLNQRVGVFRNIDEKKLNYKFLSQFVFSRLFFSQIKKVLVAGAQPNISSKDIESFKIKIPKDLKEQKIIADFLSKIDKNIEAKSEAIEKAEKWKKGVMQGVFI